MTSDCVPVDLVRRELIGFIVWFFWMVRTRGVWAATGSSGFQE